MTDLRNQRRVAASILKCGYNRVWIDPNTTEEVAEAVTRSDIRSLIHARAIKASQKRGISKARIRHLREQKRKGKRAGHGSRKGGKYARFPKKRRWIHTIRPIRDELRTYREEGLITPTIYRRYYLKAKGGTFRSRAHLRSHMVSDGVLKEMKEKVAKKPSEKVAKAKKIIIKKKVKEVKKKEAPKKAPPTKVQQKKEAPKKASPTKVQQKKEAPKKAPPKKVQQKKEAPKKAPPKKTGKKSATPKKAAPKKTEVKKPKKLPVKEEGK